MLMMSIRPVKTEEYSTLLSNPVFSGVEFKELSQEPLQADRATHCVQGEHQALVSALELAVFAREYDIYSVGSLTRTIALYYYENGEWLVAFNDDEKNIFPTRAPEGRRNHEVFSSWRCGKDEPEIAAMIVSARRDNRIVEVPTKMYLDLSLDPSDPKSFEKDPLTRAILGKYAREQTEVYRRQGAQQGIIRYLHPHRLKELALGEDNVEVRLVAISGVEPALLANYRFSERGYARTVAHPRSFREYQT